VGKAGFGVLHATQLIGDAARLLIVVVAKLSVVWNSLCKSS